MRVWLFQANQSYLLTEKVPPLLGNIEPWAIARNRDAVAVGEIAVLWQSGNKAGIYAIGEIAKPRYLDSDGQSWVNIRYDQLLKQPILKLQIDGHPPLSDLAVLKMPKGGNAFPVTEAQWTVIWRLIANDRPSHKLTRIIFNTENWQRPSKHRVGLEMAGTYSSKFGFGHEEWLFGNEWQIDGWRYAFIQGVNKSYANLVAAKQPFDLTLFTVQPDKQRRFVATIRDIECLDDNHVREAVSAFKKRGWFDTMVKETKEVGGNPAGLGNPKWARDILNVRFRLEKVEPFARNSFAKPTDPVQAFNRYQLYSPPSLRDTSPQGTTSDPSLNTFRRRGTGDIECTPEHAHMQMRLMEELKKEFPDGKIVRERDYVDVTVETSTWLIFFEIKSDLEPRTVIRHALGQILEYAFHPSRTHTLPLALVIVGRCPLPAADRKYLDRLKTEFSLPLEYRAVPV